MTTQHATHAYEPGQHPDLKPPLGQTGILLWIRKNLFANPLSIILTLVSAYLLYKMIPPAISWLFTDAVFVADSRASCREQGSGACWGFIHVRWDQFVYGFYPAAERWRVNLAFVLMLVALAPLLWSQLPARRQLLWFSLAFPFIGYWLLSGGLGLNPVDTTKFGGFMLTIVIGVTGIVCSLPLGIALALGRQSDMMLIRAVCVGFIEFIRGVPLITLLFVASTMLNYFLPPGTTFDLLLRVLIMVILFSAAYIAEVVRGGLQAIPKGQTEAAEALGLRYWPYMSKIILPQALKISIPGIVNTFIGLFKDTTLVIVIGLLDPLGMGRLALSDSKWQGLSTEVYVFIAIFFFICCFSMSRYSIYLEKQLHTGHKES
jgi:general L-amino acid transport system permease protein